MRGCLSENTLAEALEGSLVGANLDDANQHLADCAKCHDLFTELQLLYSSRGLGKAAGELLAPGATIGRYAVLDVIGSGAMGTVYAAHDPALARRIALKLVRSLGADASVEDARERLLREAQAMAQLHHPNVVAVHDVGTFGDQVFLAMELVEGQTLTQWLRSRTRSYREILQTFVQAARGLEAAHAAGLVHRDFKPDNVLVDGNGHVRVTDFGLARFAGPGHRDDQAEDDAAPRGVHGADAWSALAKRLAATVGPLGSATDSPLTRLLTRTGVLVGTPAYMAPEQYAGQAADSRSDQFSFSVALYEALFGQRPFVGNSLAEIFDQVAAGRIVRPTHARVPSRLHAILARGLRADPRDRFPSMNALLAELTWEPGLLRRRWFQLTAAVVVAVGVGSSWFLLHRFRRHLCSGGPQQLAGVWDGPRRQKVESGFRNSHVAYADAMLKSCPRMWWRSRCTITSW
jgi:serine/threonine protein kinase